MDTSWDFDLDALADLVGPPSSERIQHFDQGSNRHSGSTDAQNVYPYYGNDTAVSVLESPSSERAMTQSTMDAKPIESWSLQDAGDLLATEGASQRGNASSKDRSFLNVGEKDLLEFLKENSAWKDAPYKQKLL